MLLARCETCHAPFPPSIPQPAGARLEDSFLVLPPLQQQMLLHGGVGMGSRADAQALAHVHDKVQNASVLTELARQAPEHACQVPLCAECALFVLRDFEGRARDLAEQNATITAALHDERRRAAAETQLHSVRCGAATRQSIAREALLSSPARLSSLIRLRPPSSLRTCVLRIAPLCPASARAA